MVNFYAFGFLVALKCTAGALYIATFLLSGKKVRSIRFLQKKTSVIIAHNFQHY